jgi:transposase
MIHNILGKCKDIFIDSINKLKGADRRIAIAKVSKAIGKGGQRIVAKEFNVSRDTIRKGTHELESGFRIIDAYNARGRKKAEEKLPDLLEDIKDIVDCQSQTDPSFKTTRLFTRLTVQEVRNQLVQRKDYSLEELPTLQTLNTKINNMGYTLKKVMKTKPLKKIPETDMIFENVNRVRDKYKNDIKTVMISIDTKDRVKIGNFSRNGKCRYAVEAADHDFGGEFITPFGILDLTDNTVELKFTESKATADFMVDAIQDFWTKKGYTENKERLVIFADNGPENSSRRTQFMKRIIEFSAKNDVKVILAYYPPYHSKYNPVERVWGVLEKHWNGDILDSRETTLKFAGTMTWDGKTPSIDLAEKVYETGKTVKKETMQIYEKMIERADTIGKWFVTIDHEKCKEALNMEIKT